MPQLKVVWENPNRKDCHKERRPYRELADGHYEFGVYVMGDYSEAEQQWAHLYGLPLFSITYGRMVVEVLPGGKAA
jgi:hypothetical protein